MYINKDKVSKICNKIEWINIVESYERYASARRALRNSDIDMIDLMRRALSDQDAWPLAFELARSLRDHEFQSLFPDLLKISISGYSMSPLMTDIILSYDKDWIRANIESIAHDIIENATEYIELSELMHIYMSLSVNLSRRLAVWASKSKHPSVRDWGMDWLNNLPNPGNALT